MAAKKKGAAKKDVVDTEVDPQVTDAAKALAKAEAANPKATTAEKAEFAVEKEKRETRLVEANAKSMRDGQVAETKDGKTGVAHTAAGVVIFNVGEFAFRPLKEVPTWYLHHLMGDALDYIKWRSLTKEQQVEVKKELDARKSAAAIDQSIFPPGQGAGAVSDLETKQETRAKQASSTPVGTGPQAPIVPLADSLGKGTGTVGAPGGQPMIEGSRKETDKAIDKAVDEGSVGTGEKSAKGGVTGVETGTSKAREGGAAKKTKAATGKK